MAQRKTLKLTTSVEIRKTINRVANMVLNNELDPKRANTILFACNMVISTIRIDDQQKKLDELEGLVLERKRESR